MEGLLTYFQPRCCRRAPSSPLGIAAECLRAAAAFAGVEVSEVAGPGRRQGRGAQARHLAAYLAHVACGLPQRRIARNLGCHVSSIAYGIRRIEEARETPLFDAQITALESRLRHLRDGRGQ